MASAQHLHAFEAAATGDLHSVQEVLHAVKSPGFIDDANERGWNMLMFAARYGQTSVVRFLIERGASISKKTKEGRTARDIAEQWGYLEIAKLLTPEEAEASSDARNATGSAQGSLGRRGKEAVVPDDLWTIQWKKQPPRNFFSGSILNRASDVRGAAEWLAKQHQPGSKARYLCFANLDPLFVPNNTELAWLPFEDVASFVVVVSGGKQTEPTARNPPIFLGIDESSHNGRRRPPSNPHRQHASEKSNGGGSSDSQAHQNEDGNTSAAAAATTDGVPDIPEGTPLFALDLTPLKPNDLVTPEAAAQSQADYDAFVAKMATRDIAFRPTRPTAFMLGSITSPAQLAQSSLTDGAFKGILDAAILSQARAVLDWNLRNPFCPACGKRTISGDAGYKRKCANASCFSQQGLHNFAYPRTDPVVIVLVISPGTAQRPPRCLLGRQIRFPTGMYSCIAGFMEPGETIEEAARREVFEETSVHVGAVAYHSSQPWPFPSSVMIGCIAEAVTEDVYVGDEATRELEDARWFTREEVLSAIREARPRSHSFAGSSSQGSSLGSLNDLASKYGKELPLRIPPPYAIAHQLACSWAESNASSWNFQSNTSNPPIPKI